MRIGYMKQTFKYFIYDQNEALAQYGCEIIHKQPINNPNYKQEILDGLQEGDTLVIYRFIIIALSIQELLQIMNQLQNKGVVLQTIKPKWNSRNSYNMDQLLLYLSEFFEDIYYQKQQLGIIKAKAKGKHIGRPRKLSNKQLVQALELKQYKTNLQVANQFKVSKSTLLRNLGELRAG